VQQIGADASEEIARLESAKELDEKLQTLNRLWADIARKLGRRSVSFKLSFYFNVL